MAISRQESKAIAILKTSLVFFVIYGHMNPDTVSFAAADFSILSFRGISNALAIAISYTFAHAIVPTYFLLSGYLFWAGIEGWNWKTFSRKLKSRSQTLLLPYILWNAISIGSFILYIIYQIARGTAIWADVADYWNSVGFRGFWDISIWGTYKTNWIGMSIPSSAPIDLPIWFIRDLMVVTLFAPALYWLFKKTKFWGLLILLFCFVSKIWPQIHGFSVDSFSCFGLGLYMAMNGKTLVGFAEKIRIPALIYTLVAAAIVIYYDSVRTVEGRFCFPFFALGCIWVYLYLALLLVRKWDISLPNWLVKSSFFIYALHACPLPRIGTIISKVNSYTVPAFAKISTPWIIWYLLSPLIIIGVCLTIFYIIEWCAPGLCRALGGNRLQKAQANKVQ